jgi:hypothetical protein
MKSAGTVLFRLIKLLAGAVIIIAAGFGVLLNLHDWIFLLFSLLLLVVGLSLFLTPIFEND